VFLIIFIFGPGNSVCIATDYGLDSPGGDENFRPSRPALGPAQPPVKWVLGLYWQSSVARVGADHSPPSSAVVIEE